MPALTSWNDTPTRAAIVQFVEMVTDPDTDWFLPPEERVAVFDNDGTLWSEKPMPIQLDFTIRRFGEMAAQDPSLQGQQPWKAAYEKDFQWFGAAMVKHYQGDDSDLKALMGAMSEGLRGREHQRVRREGERVLREGRPSDAGAALPRLWIQADGRVVALSGGEWVHHLHRLRGRP